MTNLTNEEKINVINQHKRNIQYNKYNIEISLLEENAVATPNAETVDSLNEQLLDINRKITALDEEIASLTE